MKNPAKISRFAKERYLRELNEDEFRDRIVRPLMLHLGFTDGRDLCGPEEYGKDAAFFDRSKFGSLELHVVQTKTGKINLSSKASQNLIDIVAQLRTASSHLYTILQPSRTKLKPKTTYLIASGEINEAARSHISDSIQDANIEFFDSNDVITKIDEFIPDVWLNINIDVLSYFRELESQLLGGEGIFARQFIPVSARTDEFFDDNATSVKIRPKNDTKTLISKKRKRDSSHPIESIGFPLNAILDKPSRKSLILGEGGSGKTIGLMQILYRTLKKGIDNKENCLIPILMKASELVDIQGELDEHIQKTLLQKGLSTARIFSVEDLELGRVVIIVDALDEVALLENKKSVLSLLDIFSTKYSKTKIVLTCRPYEFISELKELSDYEQYSVLPLGWTEAERILNSSCSSQNKISSQVIRDSISQLSKLQGFDLSPLMLHVYAASGSFDVSDIPPNITELFKRYTEQMLGRWDEVRGLKHLHKPAVKDFVLQSIAFEMHRSDKTRISIDDAKAIAENELKSSGHQFDEKVLAEIFSRSGLFRSYNNEFSFKHHMFQEFFAGRKMTRDDINSFKHNEWWRRPIVFYFGEHPREADEILPLLNMQGMDTDDIFSSLLTCGLSLQACYLSNVDNKISIWKEITKTFAKEAPQFIQQHPIFENTPILNGLLPYQFIKDAISLSNVTEHLNSLEAWLTLEDNIEQRITSQKLVYLCLMRLGRFDLIDQQKILDMRDDKSFSMVALMELYEASNIRPLSNEQKGFASTLFETLQKEQLPSLLPQIINEVKTQRATHLMLQDEVTKRIGSAVNDNPTD